MLSTTTVDIVYDEMTTPGTATGAAAARPWFFVREARPPSDSLLVCFAHAGAGPSVFREWPYLLDRTAIASACLPGRESRFGQPLLTRLEDGLPDLGAALLPLLDRPFALFGHSLGGLIAYEAAQWLARSGGPEPTMLFVSACPAPHRLPRDVTYNLPDEQFLAMIRAIGGLPDELLAAPELLGRVLAILRADLALMDTYAGSADPPLRCPIRGFHGTADPRTSRDEMLDWDRYTTAGYHLEAVPGGHFYVKDNPVPLLRRITAHLATVPG